MCYLRDGPKVTRTRELYSFSKKPRLFCVEPVPDPLLKA